jgi:hypothetical protein
VSLVNTYIVKIHIPVDGTPPPDTLLRDLTPTVSAIVSLFEDYSAGVLGNYSGVYELSAGEEWFTPEEDATPTEGEVHEDTSTPTVVLTTYLLDLGEENLNGFIQQVVDAHPWEHPVIEVYGPEAARIWLPE